MPRGCVPHCQACLPVRTHRARGKPAAATLVLAFLPSLLSPCIHVPAPVPCFTFHRLARPLSLTQTHTHTRARARTHAHTRFLCLSLSLSRSVRLCLVSRLSPRLASLRPPTALLHTGCSLRKSFQRRSRESNRNCETECRGFEGRLPQSVACYSREDHEGGVTFAFLTPTPGYAGAPAGLSILSLSLAPFCAPNPSAWCHAATQVIDHETKEDLQVVPIGMLAYCTQGQKDPNVCVCPEPSLPSLVVTGLR